MKPWEPIRHQSEDLSYKVWLQRHGHLPAGVQTPIQAGTVSSSGSAWRWSGRMSFHRKRKRWFGPGLDPNKSLEIWKARHPHEDIPVPHASEAPALPAIASETAASPRGWLGKTGPTLSGITEIPDPGTGRTAEVDPPRASQTPEDPRNPDPPTRLLEADNPFTPSQQEESGSTDPDARTDGVIAASTGGRSTIRNRPGHFVSRPRSLLLRLIRFAARFVRKPGSRRSRQTPPAEPPPTKGLGEQVDEFVELLTSGNSLPAEHRDKLMAALRGGLESGPEYVAPEAFQTEESEVAEIPSAPESASVADPVPPPVPKALVPDPTVELQRQQELLAKDRQIEILEVKVRRLAAMLKERERRNAEAMEQAARNRSRLPGMSRLQRKSPDQPKEGASDLMLGIRELNRQIREEIQSLYAGEATDPKSVMPPTEEPEKPRD